MHDMHAHGRLFMKKHIPQLLCEGFIFPESPRWHRGSFYCCSIDEGRLFKLSMDGSKEVFLESPDRISGWVFPDENSDDLIITAGKARKVTRSIIGSALYVECLSETRSRLLPPSSSS